MRLILSLTRKEFLDCIDRASLLIKDSDKKPIIINVNNSNIYLKIDSILGSMNEEIEIKKEGKDIIIGFNPKFIMDALRVIDDENISIYLVNSKSPCFIRDEKNSYIYLILPININNAI
jgi:DNA polymerase-3 subunit beta